MPRKTISRPWNVLWISCIFALPSGAAAQESWADKVIITKKLGIKIGHTDKDGKQIYLATLTEPEYAVVKDQDGWLKVRTRRGVEGWFEKSDAVLLENAEAYFTSVIKIKPGDASAYYFRGVVLLLKTANDAALQDLGTALRLDPKMVPAYIVRGRLFTEVNNLPAAMKDLDEAIRLEPGNVVAYLARGVAWRVKKDQDSAIKDFNEAIRLDPGELEGFLGRGICHGAKKDYDQAIKDFSEVIRLDPKHATAYTERGLAWVGQKEPDKAVKDFDEVIRLEPKNAEAMCFRGDVWKTKKDFVRALADFTEATKVDPESAYACNACAWLLATCPEDKIRDGKKAVELARKAVKLTEEKDPVFFDTLAAAHAEAGDFAEAVRCEERALADENFAREDGKSARERLELYRNKKPFRD